MNSHDTCKRCGDCCRSGGPALHRQDLPLIQDGTIPLADIVTLRAGERAYDQPSQSLKPLDSEILKLKGRDATWTCIYYSPEGRACGMYDSRPIECELLFCRDTAAITAMYDKERLARADLLPAGHPLLELVAEHDAKCAPQALEEAVKAARRGDAEAGAALKEMVVFDQEMRRLVAERSAMSRDITEFLFGRPLRTLLRTMNVNVYEVGGSIRFDFGTGEK
ncbi:YkgJ family cysteine cluster protein [Pseudodesulfovibrio pelocollis]|uniref:YkgJ family cysteine cluster protein n=1 Tax=Pseudodesulfovibrio pelocollis TaxID=3051432 RepID=UPI00255A8D5F|nr:YkgJ family cysteine cluster protein [Pseudodesulfovibrio sp. SB368]